jgi:hypothetical protein
MKYTVETDTYAMINIPSFLKIGLAIQKFIGEDTQTHREEGNRISML